MSEYVCPRYVYDADWHDLPCGDLMRRSENTFLQVSLYVKTVLLFLIFYVFFIFNVSPLSATECQERLTDGQIYKKGSFTAFAAAYNRGGLREGVDYNESIIYCPTTFPSNVHFKWDWPMHEKVYESKVRSFIAIDFGDYLHTNPIKPIPASKIKDILNLTTSQDLRVDGSSAGFNIIIDFFLTKTKGSDKTQYEVEILLHSSEPAKAFRSTLSEVGKFVDEDGRQYAIYRDSNGAHGANFMIFSGEYMPSINLGAILNDMRRLHLLSGDEYLNGLALGAEPLYGNGSLWIKSFQVSFLVR